MSPFLLGSLGYMVSGEAGHPSREHVETHTCSPYGGPRTEEREHPSVVTRPTFTQPQLLCFPPFPIATKAWLSRQTNNRALDVQPCAQSLPLNTNAPESEPSTGQAALKNQLEAFSGSCRSIDEHRSDPYPWCVPSSSRGHTTTRSRSRLPMWPET